jgi:hypothetical protein
MSEQAARSHASSFFFSKHGLRSGWRTLLFVALLLAITIPVMIPIRGMLNRHGRTAETLLVVEMVSSGCVFLATWIMARFVEHQPVTTFGLAGYGAKHRLLAGVLCGFAALSLLVGVLDALGYEQFSGLSVHGLAIWRFGAMWGLVFVFVAINEELTTRGYLLFTLTQGIGFWPAAIVLSALFAAGHLKNPGEQFIGIFAAGLIGVVLAWTVRWTGSLWWAMGYHAAWDWAETYFYGVPDSGTVAPGHLLNSTAHGPEWLSGGSAGPEGSIFVLPVVLVLIWVVRSLFPRTPPAGLERLR